MQLRRREPDVDSGRFAIVAGLAIAHAAVRKYCKVLCVHVPNNGTLDVIVYHQHRLRCFLGEQQQSAQKCDSQKNESHKQQFTSRVNPANQRLIQWRPVKEERLAIFRQPVG